MYSFQEIISLSYLFGFLTLLSYALFYDGKLTTRLQNDHKLYICAMAAQQKENLMAAKNLLVSRFPKKSRAINFIYRRYSETFNAEKFCDLIDYPQKRIEFF